MRTHRLGLCLLVTVSVAAPASDVRAQPSFLRGDVNCDGSFDLIDTWTMREVLFSGMVPPCACDAAYDVDCNGVRDASDLVFGLSFLVTGGPPPCAPFPVCGPGPLFGLTCTAYPACPLFKRGDANQDGCVSDLDAQFISAFLFLGGPAPLCMQSADANDDDVVDNMDAVLILSYCNAGGPPPTAPGPLTCGADPTPGVLTCGSYPQAACASVCRNQLVGDCNGDGTRDISDASCVLSALFLGMGLMPCANGSPQHPSNIALMDCNGDLSLNVSDAVWLLAFLFQGGPPPVAGLGCISIAQCPQNVACPTCVP